MDTSRLNHIVRIDCQKGSGGKLTGTEQQELEEWIRASRMNRESYDRIISGGSDTFDGIGETDRYRPLFLRN